MSDDKATTATIQIFDADGKDITEESMPSPSGGSTTVTCTVSEDDDE